MLKEYFEIQKQIKDLEDLQKNLRAEIIKKGTHSERNFICEVREQTKRSISLGEIEKQAKPLAIELENLGLIKTSTSHVVKVTQKGRGDV